MKKQLLTGAFLLASFFANAQLLNGTFNNAAALAGWTVIDADGDSFNWGIFTGNATTNTWGFSGDFAGSRSYLAAAPNATPPTPERILTPDNYIITPVVVVPAGGATLKFLTGYTYYSAADGPAEQIDVYVTTEVNPTPTQFAALTPVFTKVFNTPNNGSVAPVAESVTVSLAAYAGQTVKVGFRHHISSNQGILLLDEVIVTSGVAGVKDAISSSFSVFPNPSNGVVTVANTNALINAIAVTDMNGRTVKNVKVGGVASTEVNISDLASGVYMMSISSDKGTSTQKIVKN